MFETHLALPTRALGKERHINGCKKRFWCYVHGNMQMKYNYNRCNLTFNWFPWMQTFFRWSRALCASAREPKVMKAQPLGGTNLNLKENITCTLLCTSQHKQLEKQKRKSYIDHDLPKFHNFGSQFFLGDQFVQVTNPESCTADYWKHKEAILVETVIGTANISIWL